MLNVIMNHVGNYLTTIRLATELTRSANSPNF